MASGGRLSHWTCHPLHHCPRVLQMQRNRKSLGDAQRSHITTLIPYSRLAFCDHVNHPSGCRTPAAGMGFQHHGRENKALAGTKSCSVLVGSFRVLIRSENFSWEFSCHYSATHLHARRASEVQGFILARGASWQPHISWPPGTASISNGVTSWPRREESRFLAPGPQPCFHRIIIERISQGVMPNSPVPLARANYA